MHQSVLLKSRFVSIFLYISSHSKRTWVLYMPFYVFIIVKDIEEVVVLTLIKLKQLKK